MAYPNKKCTFANRVVRRSKSQNISALALSLNRYHKSATPPFYSDIQSDASFLIIQCKDIPDLEITKPITIGDECYIGNNVILLPGVTIGNHCIIGAGAIVSRDIPNNSVAVGVPARVIKTTDEYLEKIKKESLHLGHLKGKEKDIALMKYYNYQGTSKGIYF